MIEFAHRAMSGAALIAIFFLLVWGLRLFPKGHHQRVGFIGSAVFILIEALLGAGLVLFELVAENSSAFRAGAVAVHLLNTFILLAFLSLNAWWASGGGVIRLGVARRGYLALFGLGLAGVAVIGMSGAITALGDTLFPSESIAHTLQQQSEPGAHFLVALRVYHPILAVFISLYTLYLARHFWQQGQDATTRRLSVFLILITLVQLGAGTLNVILLAPVWMQVIHLLIADLLWVSYVLLAAHSLRGD